MEIKKLTLPAPNVVGTLLFLISRRDWIDFTSKKRKGSVYSFVAPQKSFELFEVKIEDVKPAITINNEEIENANFVGQYIPVNLVNGIAKLYTNYSDGKTRMSLFADDIQLTNPKS